MEIAGHQEHRGSRVALFECGDDVDHGALGNNDVAAEEIETRVVAPLEMELLGVPQGVMLRSMAKYAIADITIDFAEGTDIYWARQQVAERFANASDSLPDDVSGGLAPISTPLSDVFMFTVEGEGLSLTERRTLLDWTLRPALRTLPGVADVNVLGGHVGSFVVVPDRARLNANNVLFSDVVNAVSRNNRNDGAGRIGAGEETLIVRAEGAIRSMADLEAIVIRSGVNPVRIGDVAEVRVDSLTRYGAVTQNGKGEAVQGIVVALRGADFGSASSRAFSVAPGVNWPAFHLPTALARKRAAQARSQGEVARYEQTVLQAVEEHAPVRQLGQGVEVGLLLDAGLIDLALGDVARHLRKAQELAPVVPDRIKDSVGPEARAVLADPPALGLVPPVARRRAQRPAGSEGAGQRNPELQQLDRDRQARQTGAQRTQQVQRSSAGMQHQFGGGRMGGGFRGGGFRR